MLLCLVSFLALGASSDATSSPPSREEPVVAAAPAGDEASNPSIAVFAAPLTVLSGVAWAPVSHSKPIVLVAAGVAFSADTLEWALDLAFMQRDAEPGFTVGLVGRAPSIGALGFAGGWVGFGPIFRTGHRALHGFFVNPKLIVGFFAVGPERQIFDAMVGADVGYQLTLGHFYLAVVLGASLGVGSGDNDLWAGPLTAVPLSFPRSGLSVAGGLNMQLLRVGLAF
jgi:hypothetical protein